MLLKFANLFNWCVQKKQCFELICIFPPLQGYRSLKNIQATVWQISGHNTLVRCHQFSNFCEIQRKTCSVSWACTLNYHTDFKPWMTNNYACNCIYVWRIRASKVLWLVAQVLHESSIKLVSKELHGHYWLIWLFFCSPTHTVKIRLK